MLATSPASSPQLHSSTSTSSIHYTRPSNPSPRTGSLRTSTASTKVKTKDAGTQYAPLGQEQESKQVTRGGEGTTISDNSTNAPRKSGQQYIPETNRPPPESPAIKRTSGDASLPSSDSNNPLKRAKAELASSKVLPAQYEKCDPTDLVVMLSVMLDDLVRINDPNQLNKTRLTRFHSRVAPGISIQDYLQRLTTHLVLQPTILLTMCFYLDRLCVYYSEFSLNSLTCHRFLITSATVASKGLSDAFWNNSTYARVGGVKLSELALLELEFLYRVDWRIIPDNATLVAYYHGLITRTAGYSLAPTRPPAPESLAGSVTSNESNSTEVSDDSTIDPDGSPQLNPAAEKLANDSASEVDGINTPANQPNSSPPSSVAEDTSAPTIQST